MTKKKFAYVQHTLIPSQSAHSVFVVKICEAVVELGCKVTLVAPGRLDEVDNYYQLNHKFNKKSFGYSFWPVNWLPKSNIKRSLEILVFALRAWWYCRKQKIQVVQTACIEVVAVFGLLSRFYRPQTIYDAHMSLPWWVRRGVVSAISLAVATTTATQEELVKLGLPRQSVMILPMGYDPKQYKQVSSSGLNQLRKEILGLKLATTIQDKVVIGFVGRFETLGVEKGVGLLLSSLAKLSSKDLNVFGLIVGGPEAMIADYRTRANQLGLQEGSDYHFVGTVAYAKVPNMIACFDIAWMVYPKHPHFEINMSPMKAIEYMASGKPIIASDFASVRAILSDQEAFLVDPSNQDQIVATLEHVLAHPLKAGTKGHRASKRAAEFTWTLRQKKVMRRLG